MTTIGARRVHADMSRAAPRVGEAAIGGGRDAGLAAEILGEALRAFELAPRLRRAEDPDAGGSQIVGEPGDQRRLRPDDDEVDRFAPAEGDDRRMVGWIERHAFGDAADAGIARRGVELGQQRRGRQLPGQRMLAAARADEKDTCIARQS